LAKLWQKNKVAPFLPDTVYKMMEPPRQFWTCTNNRGIFDPPRSPTVHPTAESRRRATDASRFIKIS